MKTFLSGGKGIQTEISDSSSQDGNLFELKKLINNNSNTEGDFGSPKA